MPDEFIWNKATRLFEDPSGAPISRDQLRSIIMEYIDSVVSEAESVTQSFLKGETNLAGWELEIRRLVKESQGALGSIASGGWQSTTPSQWGYIGTVVKEQYKYLDSWQRDMEAMVERGESPTVSMGRLAMYIRDAVGTFENVLRRLDGDSGQIRQERRLLTPGVSHCKSCLFYAKLGWTPIGVLPEIGVDCECMSNCLCYFETR